MAAIKLIKQNHQLLGTLQVLTSGLLYGLIGYFGLQLYAEGLSVPTLLFWRFFVAAMWMLAAFAIFRRPGKRKPSAITRAKMLQTAVVGSISYVGGSTFFYLSSLHIGTGCAMVIFFSFPVFVTLFSVYFRHSKLNRYVLLSLVMVVVGLSMLNHGGENVQDIEGILLALVASFSYGVYVYYSKHHSTKADSLLQTLAICLGCAMISLFVAVLSHSFSFPTSWLAIRNILILGIVSTAIPIQLLLNGLRYISSVKASILSVTEPLTTVLIGVLFMDESLSVMQIAGIIIILSGALAIQFEKQPEFNAETPLK